ncbi:Lsr2 family DNA-binding protein [Sphaerimonospora sp. CA-214678]|uniref:Lsr2 family DNA-binding protein n=1 Tax=Sphaerimonospora sp. CA-214678 TaxID=3240029 RepID=UPI003D92EF2B
MHAGDKRAAIGRLAFESPLPDAYAVPPVGEGADEDRQRAEPAAHQPPEMCVAQGVDERADQVDALVDGQDGLEDGDPRDLEEFVIPALPTSQRSVTSPGRVTEHPVQARTTAPNASISQIRTWARRNGYNVGDRGRLPQDVIEAYHLALETD